MWWKICLSFYCSSAFTSPTCYPSKSLTPLCPGILTCHHSKGKCWECVSGVLLHYVWIRSGSFFLKHFTNYFFLPLALKPPLQSEMKGRLWAISVWLYVYDKNKKKQRPYAACCLQSEEKSLVHYGKLTTCWLKRKQKKKSKDSDWLDIDALFVPAECLPHFLALLTCFFLCIFGLCPVNVFLPVPLLWVRGFLMESYQSKHAVLMTTCITLTWRHKNPTLLNF